MAIAFDNSTVVDLSGTTALSTSFTCSGTNRILFVMAMSSSTAWGGFTYNGVALTQIQTDQTASHLIGLWYLVNPASGSNTLAGTWGGNQAHSVVVASYNGVKQSSPINASTTATGSGTSLTTTASSTTDNCWGILAGGTGGATSIDASTNAVLISRVQGNIDGLFHTNTPITPAGSFGMTFTGASATKASIMAFFAPALIISSSDSITMTDTLSKFVRQKVISVSDTINIIQVILFSAFDSITTSDVIQSFKKGWNNATKNISNWINEDKH